MKMEQVFYLFGRIFGGICRIFGEICRIFGGAYRLFCEFCWHCMLMSRLARVFWRMFLCERLGLCAYGGRNFFHLYELLFKGGF